LLIETFLTAIPLEQQELTNIQRRAVLLR